MAVFKQAGAKLIDFIKGECWRCNDIRRHYNDRYVCDYCWDDFKLQEHIRRVYLSGGKHGVCQFPGCKSPQYWEQSGRLHDYCGRTHAKQHRSMIEAELRCHQQAQAHQQPVYKPQAHHPEAYHRQYYQYETQSPGYYYPYGQTAGYNPYPDTGPIRFYDKGAPYYEFTNFFPAVIRLDGKDWPTSEHYFQAQKFVGTPYEEKIRGFFRPRQAFDLSRDPQVSRWRRKDWEKVKIHVMYKALLAKFLQHSQLIQSLIGTGDRELIEHTPYDSFWGDGGDGTGKNNLGMLLMKVRSELRDGKSQPLKDTIQIEQKQKQSSRPSSTAADKSTATVTASRAAGGGSLAGQPSHNFGNEHDAQRDQDKVDQEIPCKTCPGGSPSTSKKMADSSPTGNSGSTGEAGAENLQSTEPSVGDPVTLGIRSSTVLAEGQGPIQHLPGSESTNVCQQTLQQMPGSTHPLQPHPQTISPQGVQPQGISPHQPTPLQATRHTLAPHTTTGIRPPPGFPQGTTGTQLPTHQPGYDATMDWSHVYSSSSTQPLTTPEASTSPQVYQQPQGAPETAPSLCQGAGAPGQPQGNGVDDSAMDVQ